MRPTVTAVLSALAVTCCAVAATPPAWAAAPAGNAPSCVTVWEKTGRITKTGYVRNDCGSKLRLKIKWARGTDSACQTVEPGETIWSQVPRGIRSFDGADGC
ncbi:hypothetical protein FH608_043155 [Nonomuraea phyllanthi]|uniref:Uncharacterized protein n=1 Tax=Nonomuraea phyllanthi TaxID=2219224 RepID=A0A5C4VDK5_9ACTN|nr:hypothetical protein [Nonomuraea phyllanthi]KAB8188572.1 hypothetical protein FH608_043155 [Nonomuraea phyllanthi]QFY13384.1 hypothetical protein GBF35_48585 [Nonomuraea phyllanthi]